MIRNLNIAYWRFHSRKIQFQEWFAKIFPFKIPMPKPKFPKIVCSICNEPFSKIVAIDTGDGWCFMWECENNCGYGDSVENWYPFWFGVWCNSKDLDKLGIEVY